MNYSDLCFVCESMVNLSLIPLRIYFKGQKQGFFDAQRGLFEKLDPVVTVERILFEKTKDISYCFSEQYLYYGAVRHGEYTLILGPVGNIVIDSFERRKLKFELAAGSDEEFDEMCRQINSLPKISIERFLNILIAINFHINGKRQDYIDLVLNGCINENAQPKEQLIGAEEDIADYASSAHGGERKAYEFERHMLSLIKNGDIDALEELFSNMPTALRVGDVGDNNLRQEKNIGNISIALVTRAAIEGGMSIEEAFELSDICIKRCEAMKDIPSILEHNHQVVLEFCRRVSRIRSAGESHFLRTVANYIVENLNRRISVEEIAQSVFMNPSSLSRKFKNESGKTLSRFIAEKRVEEACRLLENTERSLADISEYLCFSSQSHFQNTFKEITGSTPAVYRERSRF